MKNNKSLCVLTALVLLLVMILSGCSTANTPTESASDTPVKTDIVSTIHKSLISNGFEGSDSIFRLDVLSGESITPVLCRDNTVVFISGDYATGAVIGKYDLNTAEITATRAMSGDGQSAYNREYLINKHLYILKHEHGQEESEAPLVVEVYSEKLELLYTKQINSSYYKYDAKLISEGDAAFLYYTDAFQKINRLNLDNQDSQPECIADLSGIHLSSLLIEGKSGGRVFFSYAVASFPEGYRHGAVDTATGAIEEFGYGGLLWHIDNERIVFTNEEAYDNGISTIGILEIDKPGMINKLCLAEPAVSVGICTRERIYTFEGYDANAVSIYSLSLGERIAKLQSNRVGLTNILSVLEVSDEYALLNCEGAVYIWRYAGINAEDKSFALKEAFKTPAELENRILSAELEQKLGVRIYYGSDASQKVHDYKITAAFEENKINTVIKAIYRFLSDLPDGFMEEMKTDSIKGLDFVICDSIRSIEHGNIAYGVFTINCDRQLIFIDVNSNIEATIAHEFMHAIDDRVDREVAEKRHKGFYLWEVFAPENYYYTFAYYDDKGNIYDSYNRNQYTPSDPLSDKDVNRIYFIDGYSTTFPIEDRARIFEHIAVDEELPAEFKSKNLMAKAEYMCAVIRDVFSCIDETDTPFWEKNIKKVSLQYFKDNYKLTAKG